MARKPTEPESRKETISFRVTKSVYDKVIRHVDRSTEPSLSDYSRNALMDRIRQEEKQKDGKVVLEQVQDTD